MNKADFQYYAFISYSRKNSKAASYLHKQLEHFRVPVKYVAEENRPNGKFLRPVFRDRRDLEAGDGSFTAHIKTAVEKSRYLIVLCSPESAASHWVNEEIKYFLATHNNDYNAIVPVILNGEPGSGGDMECLPEILRVEEITMRNLPSMIPDDGDDEKTGWENGVIQAMSYMLKVNREKIKAIVDAEKIRQAKIYAAIGIAATIVFALLTAWAIHAERQAADAIANAQEARENEAKAKEQAKVAKESLVFLAVSFNNSGLLCHNRGAYDEALENYKKALDIRLKVLEPDHPDVATSYNNIGSVYADQGIYDKALEYYKKSLDIRLKVLEPDHPDVATGYNNIGFVYSKQGIYAKALEYYKKALDIKLKVLGSDHPSVAASYNNIGFVYSTQGNYAKALEYYKKALDLAGKSLGEQHPNTKNILKNFEMTKEKLKNEKQ